MTADQRTRRFEIVHDAGKVRDISVLVTREYGRECGYAVVLFGTLDGVSDVGEPFVGKGAKIQAIIQSELVLSALESAAATWDLGD